MPLVEFIEKPLSSLVEKPIDFGELEEDITDDNELVPEEIEGLVSSKSFSILKSVPSHKISRLSQDKTLWLSAAESSRHSTLPFADSGGRICSLTKFTDLGTFRAAWIPKESPSNFPGLTFGTWLMQ